MGPLLIKPAEMMLFYTGADSNGALSAYASDVQANYFPGLGENKRREIHHHIALNHKILRREL